ncbi:hypothetical protein ACFFH2_15575 [Enterococcus devriesei]|uniref:Uncharacterized protein n=1 Tax=Enterococcus dongliensis TaxID=2559925 RepID=A0ABU3ERB9_9ENTE|nr:MULTISPECIES: hypothetical protein [Enterococcus]MDT2570304.1 hypothetical protein [Enterococcus raffinosus]MDT2597398.1 hypothetical protein [Enterococcus dongliensis]
MTEHDNIIDVLKDLFELSDAKNITVDGKIATVEDLQEFYKESLVNLADLLGVSELYLGE